jgi:xanthine dehydrogenase YagS FAD-binding subunit
MMPRFEWLEAATVQEAIGSLDGSTLVKAGGVDLMDRLKEGLDRPLRLVNIRNIPGLDGVSVDGEGLKLGPLVTLGRLGEERIVRDRYAAISEAAEAAATPQIRNMATAGGNLLQRPRCWYFRSEQFPCLKKGGQQCFAQEGENDYHAIFANETCAAVHPSSLAVPLVAFGASIVLAGPKGTRTVPLETFFTPAETDVTRENSLGAGELITSIVAPTPEEGTVSAYVKIAGKESFDWPIAEVAVVLRRQGGIVRRASIVLGAAAHAPMRSRAAEAALEGLPITAESAAAAGRAAMSKATPLRDNAYKVPIFEVALRRAVLGAAGARGGA